MGTVSQTLLTVDCISNQISPIIFRYRVRARDARFRVMHTNTKTPKSSTRCNSTTMSSIQAAIKEIESLSPEQSFTYKEIAAKHGVNRSTLSRRHRAASTSHAAKVINQQKLNPQQELELVRYIEGLTKQGLLPTRKMIQNFASCIAKEKVGNS